TYELHAANDGSALFTRYQGWDNYGITPTGGTSQSTVTLKAVENFTFLATHDPAPMSTYPIGYWTGDKLTIGDLSSTGMTGQIYFDGGSGDDVLDAYATSNVILALGGSGNDIDRRIGQR